jgi:hypothetical protein
MLNLPPAEYACCEKSIFSRVSILREVPFFRFKCVRARELDALREIVAEEEEPEGLLTNNLCACTKYPSVNDKPYRISKYIQLY